jgi:hypothetical protein
MSPAIFLIVEWALRRSDRNYAIGAALYNIGIYGRPTINGYARKVMKLIR